MDSDFSGRTLNGSPYDQERNRADWNQVPYSAAFSGDAPTQLPPIQTGRNGYETPTSYDGARRTAPITTSIGQPPYSPYATTTPASPYAHGIQQYQQHHMFANSTPQMSPIAQQYPTSTYSNNRPMQVLAPAQPHQMQSPYGAYPFQPEGDAPEPQQQRLHVVGSQGRRGVLPSDEGRPPAVSNGATGTKSTVVPQKDADGKFPCPHCQKTYLHGKHLKRHLLRHTGDRPYSCFLCNDTFSRSDILKRHFQKCSQRRGNPTGASHLAYSQNHLKRQAAKQKQQEQQQAAARAAAQGTAAPTDTSIPAVTQTAANTMGIYTDSNVGMGTLNGVPHQLADIQIKPEFGHNSQSGAIPSPGLNRPTHTFLSGQAGSTSLPSSGNSTPLTAKTTGGFPQTFTTDAHRQQFQQPISSANQFESTNAFEWNAYSQGKDSSGSVPSAFDPAGHSLLHNDNSDNQQAPSKTVLDDSHRTSHLASNSSSNHVVVSRERAEQLISFCQLDNPTIDVYELHPILLNPSNIEHFIQSYFINFVQHFPILHVPTFDPNTTYDGLLLAIICTGAVYSDKLDHQQVRELMRRTSIAIKNTSSISTDPDLVLESNGKNSADQIVQELDAFVSILCLGLWHGDDLQKMQAMKDWPICTDLAVRLRLNEPVPSTNPKHSIFHQPGFVEDRPITDFSYDAWLWQEKRIRLMYTIFLNETVLAFFYNQPPTLDPLIIKLPLPCDDAAWEAIDGDACAKVLGFYGADQQSDNISGSLRKKQPELHLAQMVLEYSGLNMKPRATNINGKFLLIHGILLRLWIAQKYSSISALDTPLQSLDWVELSRHDPGKAIDLSPLGIVETASENWIKTWDHDTPIQYPPGVERVGYSRDGVHYYWLVKLLIQNCELINVDSPWPERLKKIIKLLKNIGTWVSANRIIRGEDNGTISLIDERYGLEDISKDLKLLFPPK